MVAPTERHVFLDGGRSIDSILFHSLILWEFASEAVTTAFNRHHHNLKVRLIRWILSLCIQGTALLYKPEVEIDGYHTLVDQGYTLSTSSASDKQSPIPTEDIVNHQGRAATALIGSFWKKVPWVWSKLLSRRWSPQSSAGAARVDARTVHIGTAERLESVETREVKRKTNHTVISPLRAFPAPLLGFFLVSYFRDTVPSRSACRDFMHIPRPRRRSVSGPQAPG